MPIPSPLSIDSSVLNFVIKVGGAAIKDYYPVISVNVTHDINRISSAEIILIDGSVSEADFHISNSPDFALGAEVVIGAGYQSGALQTIFTGIIVKHGLKITGENSNLVITCKHEAIKMTFGIKDKEFSSFTDSDIIQAIANTYTSFTTKAEATQGLYETMYQKGATDWDFILTRADFCGFIVIAAPDGCLSIGKPNINSTAVLRIGYRDSLISFQGEFNGEKQPSGIEALAWDTKDQALVTVKATEPSVSIHGNVSGLSGGKSLDQGNYNYNYSAPLTADELKTWADGNLLRMRLSAFKGQVTFIGNGGVKPGDILELEGVGTKFNGKAFVSGTSHKIVDGSWITTVRFGFDNLAVYEKFNISTPSASGILPAINGLQLGTVKQISQDPNSQYRILVKLGTAAADSNGTWARLSSFYATSSSGAGFAPEIGDEVVLGFLESDPRFPIILGSLYSSVRQPCRPATDENNFIKTLSTKALLKLTFDDEKKALTIETPAGNKITLSDDTKGITILDQNSNTIVMDSSGITLKSGKDITVDATGDITLKATGKLNLQATNDLTMEGLNVNATAKMGLTVKGSATAEISASGQTTVKGAIVMIN